jgi:tRNA 5-methylaminomethyl-2-thiouridine biosynthesis bifunctional protein
MLTHTPYAALTWSLEGEPFSRHFGDVYFSRSDGLEEARQVFLQANQLDKRFATHSQTAIGETGFGTGLNFLAAWALFARTAPAGATLAFYSVERFPLRPAEMAKALRAWPVLQPLTQQLLAAYAPYTCTQHTFSTAQHTVTLQIAYEDVTTALARLPCRMDAWFLDGFSPKKNPAMWQPHVLQQVYQHTQPHGTASTFTVARVVRDGLEQAGFSVTKIPGFGRKREMLTACRTFG